MRIARDLGDVTVLFPQGIRRLYDLPYPLFDAIRYGLMFLSFEELPKDERPPRNIWFDGDEMKKWNVAVERRRKAKFGGGSDEGDIGDVPIDGPVSENAAMRDLFK